MALVLDVVPEGSIAFEPLQTEMLYSQFSGSVMLVSIVRRKRAMKITAGSCTFHNQAIHLQQSIAKHVSQDIVNPSRNLLIDKMFHKK